MEVRNSWEVEDIKLLVSKVMIAGERPTVPSNQTSSLNLVQTTV